MNEDIMQERQKIDRKIRRAIIGMHVSLALIIAGALLACAVAFSAAYAHDLETDECSFIGVKTIVRGGVNYIQFAGINECHDNRYIIQVFHKDTGEYLGHETGRLRDGTLDDLVYVPSANVPFTYEIVFPK